MRNERRKRQPKSKADPECEAIARCPRLLAIFEKARQSFKAGKGLSHEAFWNAVEKRYGQDK